MAQIPFFPSLSVCEQTFVLISGEFHISPSLPTFPITSYNPGWTAVSGFRNQEARAPQAPSIFPHSIKQSWCKVHLQASPCPGVNVFWNLFVKRKCVLQRKEHEMWLAQSDHSWQERQGGCLSFQNEDEGLLLPWFYKITKSQKQSRDGAMQILEISENPSQAGKKSVGVSEVRWGPVRMEWRGLVVWEISLLKASHPPFCLPRAKAEITV